MLLTLTILLVYMDRIVGEMMLHIARILLAYLLDYFMPESKYQNSQLLQGCWVPHRTPHKQSDACSYLKGFSSSQVHAYVAQKTKGCVCAAPVGLI